MYKGRCYGQEKYMDWLWGKLWTTEIKETS